ncbi:hypothetical protein [Thioalkalivibrio sp. ALE17]|uniref:hypothetical protein n=1 Tax=Thioalkalivibrio sp. ALE17 TaxID=1158173 RepID=UPI0012DCC418|nr:hypothetical protein [Thioalkalivibrio sp. ALE17]
MQSSAKQGDPKEIDRLEGELKAKGYRRVDATNPKALKPGEYLRHEFSGTATSFEGPAQSRIEWRLK